MYERSYHDKAIKKDTRITKREKKRARLKRTAYIIGSLIVCTGIIFLLRIPGVQVRTVDVEGTEVLDPEDIRISILHRLSGNYLWIIPHTSILLISPTSLESVLKKEFTRIDTVQVNRTSPHTLSVAVHEYAAKYLWCTSDETCYLMDERGVVYSPAPYYSGNAYIKVYNGTLEDLPFSPCTAEELAMIGAINDRLRKIEIIPEKISFDSSHSAHIVFAHAGSSASIFFDPSLPIESSLEKLYTGLRTEPLQGLFAHPANVLQYLDLRYPKKVIYKFANM